VYRYVIYKFEKIAVTILVISALIKRYWLKQLAHLFRAPMV